VAHYSLVMRGNNDLKERVYQARPHFFFFLSVSYL